MLHPLFFPETAVFHAASAGIFIFTAAASFSFQRTYDNNRKYRTDNYSNNDKYRKTYRIRNQEEHLPDIQ